MTRGVELTWEGGEHRFLLTIPLLRALQQKCDAGPPWILQRLQSGAWHVDDVVGTLRLGLEGGGMQKEDARSLISKHVEGDDSIALSKLVFPAIAVLMEALYGLDDDQPGEGEAGEDKATPSRSRAASGGSHNSTNRPASSQSTSTKRRSGNGGARSKATSKPTARKKKSRPA